MTAIHNGLDEHYRPQDAAAVEHFRSSRGLPSRFVLSVATLEPRKNITTLIEAYARARQRLAMPLLVAGGKGWLYDAIFDRVRQLGLENDVAFLGFVARDDLPLLYAAATAFVYPSLYEGFGFPPLEAMATGTPTLVSDAGVLREVADGAALIAPARDAAALAAQLVRLTGDHALREELRARGFERARRFTWQRAASQTLEVLRMESGRTKRTVDAGDIGDARAAGDKETQAMVPATCHGIPVIPVANATAVPVGAREISHVPCGTAASNSSRGAVAYPTTRAHTDPRSE